MILKEILPFSGDSVFLFFPRTTRDFALTKAIMCGKRAVAQTYMALFSFIFIQLILLDTQGVRELTCHAEGNLLFQGTLFCLFSYRRGTIFVSIQ